MFFFCFSRNMNDKRTLLSAQWNVIWIIYTVNNETRMIHLWRKYQPTLYILGSAIKIRNISFLTEWLILPVRCTIFFWLPCVYPFGIYISKPDTKLFEREIADVWTRCFLFMAFQRIYSPWISMFNWNILSIT